MKMKNSKHPDEICPAIEELQNIIWRVHENNHKTSNATALACCGRTLW
jgi:hypothetical protein